MARADVLVGPPQPQRSQHFVDQVGGVVLELVPPAALSPGPQLDFLAAWRVLLEDRVQLAGQRRVLDGQGDLVVDLERTVVEVAGANGALRAVDGHHLLVQQGVRIFKHTHATPKQLVETTMAGVLQHWVV